VLFQVIVLTGLGFPDRRGLRFAGIGLPRRRWAPTSSFWFVWPGRAPLSSCGCRLVLGGRHVGDVGLKYVSGGARKESWQTRAATNVAARVLTHRAGPPMSWVPHRSFSPHIPPFPSTKTSPHPSGEGRGMVGCGSTLADGWLAMMVVLVLLVRKKPSPHPSEEGRGTVG
jgi:hypothetical protein